VSERPRGDRTGFADRGFAFAAAVRVVDRVHDDAANGGADAAMAIASRFADVDVFMLVVADAADGRFAAEQHHADFARRQADLCITVSLAISCALVPAERTIWAPFPGFSSIL
jgi:hypothetical protein